MMKSQGFKMAALSVAAVLVILVSFVSGIKVGSHKALFSCQWGENYKRNFMDPRPPMGYPGSFGPMMRDFDGRSFRNAHGLSGTIISVTDNKFIIKDGDGKENTVEVTDKTIIKNRGNDLKLSDLKTDDKVVIMGRPSESGTIGADLIRVFDSLLSTNSANSVTPDQNNNPIVAPTDESTGTK